MKRNTTPTAPEVRPTMSVPEAGKKYYGIGKNASYAAAACGQIPTIRIGGRLLAVVPAIERGLAEVSNQLQSKVP
jgi:hypothetical protein